jgi:hypothetical protein
MPPAEAADTSPLLPHIDIDPIEPWQRGEGELIVSSASYFNRNSPSYFFRFRCCSYIRRSSVSGDPDALPLLVPFDIDGIDLQRRREGEYFDCVPPDLTRNSPIILVLGRFDVPPAGDN